MAKYEFADYFELIFISYIVLDIQLCYGMLKTAILDSLPKDEGVNTRKKLVLEGADFDFSLILEFAMVIHFSAFYHLCHDIASNMLVSYLFYLYWNPHT